jgi:hypothetical protein
MKALAETFDLYKGVNPIMPRWEMALAGTPPMDAAFHDGAIRYLREAGQWTAEHQSWQDTMLKRHRALQKAWAEFLPEAQSRNLSEEDLGKAWGERRSAALAALT